MAKISLSMTPEKCGLLDAVLRAFNGTDHFSKETILPIFDGDENIAADYIDILAQLRYVRKIGEIEGSRLGQVFYKEPGLDLFLSEGGFTTQYNKKVQEQKQADKRQNLETQNLELQNEALRYQTTIRDQEGRIRNLDEKVKRFEMLKNYEWIIRLAFGVFSAAIAWWFTKCN